MTFVAGLRRTGLVGPLALDGPMRVQGAELEKSCPAIRRHPHGAAAADARRALDLAGTRLFAFEHAIASSVVPMRSLTQA